MSTGYDLDIGDVIAQVNVVRNALGFEMISELPNARRGDPAACLFYRALADCGVRGVYGDRITFASERQASLAAELWGTRTDGGSNVTPPTQMRRTISNFDDSKFSYYNE
jgi:hypothetical protein